MSRGSIEPIRIELPTNFAVGPVNSYLFTTPEPILIDTGVDSEESWEALVAGLAAEETAVSDLKRIIITHAHTDHFGMAHRLLAESDAQLWIADLGAEWLTTPQEKFQRRIDFYRNHFLPAAGADEQLIELTTAGMAAIRDSTTPIAAERIVQFKVGDTLQLGKRPWQVLHMPGHASHQTCFYQPDTKQFISADMLLPLTPTPLVECPPDGKTRQPSLPTFLESMEKVKQLNLEQVYPGHGDPFSNVDEIIKRQEARIEVRKNECFGLVNQGLDTAVALTNEMYGRYHPQLHFAGLWMLIGYLDLLVAEDKVTTVQEGKLIRYKVK